MTTHFLLAKFWTGWRRALAWLVCVGAIFLLGVVHRATDAEFAFASLVLLPVLVIAWISGKWGGLLVSVLAAVTWAVGDIAAERQFTDAWIPWANAVTRFLTYGLVALLAGQVRRQFDREHDQATKDALTGLKNRREFLEVGAAEAERSRRYRHPLAVVFLDLDDFKQLNDTRGHQTGDAALRAAAGALRHALRSSDRIARLGGDEFGILLPETTYEAAVDAGNKILGAVNKAVADYPPVRASIGLAWFGESDRSFAEMLKAADELMYEVKESGKSQVRTHRFDAVTAPDAQDASSIEQPGQTDSR